MYTNRNMCQTTNYSTTKKPDPDLEDIIARLDESYHIFFRLPTSRPSIQPYTGSIGVLIYEDRFVIL